MNCRGAAKLKQLIDERKKTVVFLGNFNEKGQPQFFGTGFLSQIDRVTHLITAKHVIRDEKTGNPTNNQTVFFNTKDGKIRSTCVQDMKKLLGVDWIFHADPSVDIAMIPFALDERNDDVLTMQNSLFMKTSDLYENYDVFFMSYQPGIEATRRITPIIRRGTISLISDDGSFYIDGSAFPGNSGSPVFLSPSLIRYTQGMQGNVSLGKDELRGMFLGIVGEYVPYREVAISTQTNRPRIVFEENTGLSKVWSTSFIQEIIASQPFQVQLKVILDSVPKLEATAPPPTGADMSPPLPQN